MIRDPRNSCRLNAEHDNRVREARLGPERLERLLVKHSDREPWLVRLAHRLHLDRSGASAQGEDRQTRFPHESQQHNVVVAMPIPARGAATKPTSSAPQAKYWRRAA
jgi:hypothetical protein